MSPVFKQVAILVVVATLPLPILLSAGLVERRHLFWLFLSYVAVAILASKWKPHGRVADAGTNRWSFKSRMGR